MKQIKRFNGFGFTFEFEPPIEVPDEMIVKSLGDLAAHVSGRVDRPGIPAGTMWSNIVNDNLSGLNRNLQQIAGTNAQLQATVHEELAGTVEHVLENKHKVTVR